MNIIHTLTNPVVWILCLITAIVFGSLGAHGNKAPMDDPTKRSLPPELDPSKMTGGSDQIPPELHAALMEIVKTAVNGGALRQFWHLEGLRSNGYPLGSYRITIEKTA